MLPVEILKRRKAGPVVQVNIFDTTANMKDVNGPAAEYSLFNTGLGERTLSTGGTFNWTWLLSGVNSDYQVRVTLVSGTAPSGDTLSTWISLSTSRTWTLSILGAVNSLTVEIRRIVDSVVIGTAAVTMSYIDTGGGGGTP